MKKLFLSLVLSLVATAMVAQKCVIMGTVKNAESGTALPYATASVVENNKVIAAIMKHQDAPGTTFKRHMQIARGVLGEDDCLLREILFNPRTGGQVEKIRTELKELLEIIDQKDEVRLNGYLQKIRANLK